MHLSILSYVNRRINQSNPARIHSPYHPCMVHSHTIWLIFYDKSRENIPFCGSFGIEILGLPYALPLLNITKKGQTTIGLSPSSGDVWKKKLQNAGDI